MNEFIEIDFIQIEQPIGKFYIGNIDWQDLIMICEADIRKIEAESKKSNSLDSYLGIQRKTSPTRISEIKDYVKTIDATFPTSIILHIESSEKYIDQKNIKDLEADYIDSNSEKIVEIKNIEIISENKKLRIRSDDKVAKILDGQHRIEGIRNGLQGQSNPSVFQFNVTIFVDLDIDDQAQVFSVINKTHTKVNNSLVYDLYEYARHRSPQKTAHDIVRLLNKLLDSPFFRKIKILGTAENKDLETIAQATFVELILKYTSKKPMSDRDELRKNNKIPLLTDANQIKALFFRNLFIEEKDQIIMNIIWNYFQVIQEKWPTAWNGNAEGNILNKSTGVIALMRFLKHAVSSIGIFDAVIPAAKFKEIFDRITLKDNSFNRNKYIPGSSGQSQLLADLRDLSGV
jgi:DGQHR domain-containing protein